ncbi:helix-turn-helix domain-containing protein [Deinococcus taeanensis]|uniref:helix-turn-helix domain-containing protein n=1 Tax=Deinococcus taeanensis TaxID=2737050 RepID=UPI001CDCAB16|nr:helix-turn-helix domain-containing protein [Deinococcus taeanensis]UBV42603.1 helix-turn-helix domain-containing protein [Deinococcus taeanensis]
MHLLTLKETQAALRLSRSTVLHFIYSGALPASKLGRSWRIAAEDLAVFVRLRRQR